MLALSITGVMEQLLLLQASKYTAAVTLQPFNYSLLEFASVLGVMWLGEALETTLVVGALVVVLGAVFAQALRRLRPVYFHALCPGIKSRCRRW
jgi:drug/metabolite transporter (DMT)-like permease